MYSKDEGQQTTWQQRLKNLEFVPGELPPDKEYMWEVVRKRLEAKENKNSFSVYKYAAVLIILICLPWALKNNRQCSIHQNSSYVKETATTKFPVKRIIQVGKNRSPQPPAINRTADKTQIVLSEDTSQLKIKSDSLFANDNAPALVIAPPPSKVKRQLKIEHINELPERPINNTASTQEKTPRDIYSEEPQHPIKNLHTFN